MKTEQILEQLRAGRKAGEELAALIEKRIAEIEKAIPGLERALLLDLSDYMAELKTAEGGILANTARNLYSVAAIDAALVQYTAEVGALMVKLSKWAAEVADYTAEYYRVTGWPLKVVDRIAKDTARIEAALGISGGKAIRGGFIDAITTSSALKNEIKGFMVQAIQNRQSLAQTTAGLRTLIRGNKSVNGLVVGYMRNYVYDVLNEVREIKSAEFAESLGIRYFIYQGSLIATSRRFCIKRAGKVFSTKEAEGWRSDPDLIDKKTAGSYRYTQRGRHGCRHWLDYISDETAEYLLNRDKK